jgi:hypothetical protein
VGPLIVCLRPNPNGLQSGRSRWGCWGRWLRGPAPLTPSALTRPVAQGDELSFPPAPYSVGDYCSGALLTAAGVSHCRRGALGRRLAPSNEGLRDHDDVAWHGCPRVLMPDANPHQRSRSQGVPNEGSGATCSGDCKISVSTRTSGPTRFRMARTL